MAEYKFVPPSWLEKQDAETIHARMMAELPDDIDDTEGGFPWDFTKPTALEKAELLEYETMETIKLMHFMFAYGIYLDYHAVAVGLKRKGASYATGTLTVTGSPGTVIAEGFLFAVPARGDIAAITFASLEEAIIDENGEAAIPVKATEAGKNGNVAAGSIVIMASTPISSIESITNPNATSGGTEEEDDEALRQRIAEIQTASFVGNDSDYIRWAQEVAGVGDVDVIPEWNGAGTVKILVMDSNGEPANTETGGLTEQVYNHIVSPDDRLSRLAPIGATVTVTAPYKIAFSVSFKLVMKENANSSVAINTIRAAVEEYLLSTRKEGKVLYNRISAIIMNTDGVVNYEDLKVKGGASDYEVGLDEQPFLDEFNVTT